MGWHASSSTGLGLVESALISTYNINSGEIILGLTGSPMSLIALFPGKEAQKRESFLQKIKRGWFYLLQTVSGFSGALLISTFFHIVLALLLSLTTIIYFPYHPPQSQDYPTSDLGLFARALDELTKEKGIQDELAETIARLQEERLPEIANKFMVLDERMSEGEKVEIYKKLLEAYFSGPTRISPAEAIMSGETKLVSAGDSFEIRNGERVYLKPSARENGKVELYLLEREVAGEIKKLEQAGALKGSPRVGPRQFVKLKFGTSYAEVPAEYYFRRCPYEEIMAKGALNFSIIKGFPQFLIRQPGSPEQPVLIPDKLPELFPQGNFKIIYYGQVTAPEIETREPKRGQGLQKVFALEKEQWPKKLDELMVYPEEVQFAMFEQEYLQKYDWDSPALAEFTRNFINSNLNGVFLIQDAFTTAFDSLEELFYKKPIFERMARLAEDKPPSPVKDVLLFCLASSLDMERRVLINLAKAYPEAREIYLKKASVDYVFNSLPKALTLKQVYEELRDKLKRNGLASAEEALKKYRELELRIYEQLAERGGQTGAWALYATGLAFWEDGEKEKAIDIWQQIDEKNCPDSISGLLRTLKETPAIRLHQEIDTELNYQSARNTKYLYRRLQQFHKWSRRQQKLPLK